MGNEYKKIAYREFITQNAEFQRAVNLSLDMGRLDYIKSYIPTRASLQVMRCYLYNVLHPNIQRASVLIGPYGKGKSHTLFVVAALLSMRGLQADAVFSDLVQRIEPFDAEVAGMIRRVLNENICLLPVVVNDRYMDIQQAFLIALRDSLKTEGLQALLPENYYSCCLETVERWKNEHPQTYADYEAYLTEQHIDSEEFEMKLRQYDAAALDTFRSCHRAILSGAEFQPLLQSDVPALYGNIANALKRQTRFSGLFIMFDEFSKYLEKSFANRETPQFKLLQDIAEMCARSMDTQMHIICISHKTIGEYASALPEKTRSAFKAVEGRFAEIYFTSSFDGSFALISGALQRDKQKYDAFIAAHAAQRDAVIAECDALGCFSGYESSVNDIVEHCFPLHPLTCLALIKLSEKVAQNERTLFTFLADSASPLADFVARNAGEYQLAPVHLVYDYFHNTIRENIYTQELRNEVILADALMNTLRADECRLVKTVVTFMMLSDSGLLTTADMIRAAMRLGSDEFKQLLTHAEQKHIVHVRKSDGAICIMHVGAENIRSEIEQEIELRRSRFDVCTQLAELRDPGYTVPRRYNDQHEIVRFFRNIYLTSDEFDRLSGLDWLSERGFADGYVIMLLRTAEMPVQGIRERLQGFGRRDVLVVLPQTDFDFRNDIEECGAIRHLLDNTTDDVVQGELNYYLDDAVQLINRRFADMFDVQPVCITADAVYENCTTGMAVSDVCAALYPATPVICHEMINRTEVTGAMKQARADVINAIIAGDTEKFGAKTAQAVILRAVTGHTDEPRMAHVLEIIRHFVLKSESQKRSFAELYAVLTQSPYGMRKGVLPVLIAYVLRDYAAQITIYNKKQEMPLDGSVLRAFDDHAEDYSLLLEQGTQARTEYISLLARHFVGSRADGADIRDVFAAATKFMRALPRCARSGNKQLMRDGSMKPLDKNSMELRRLLLVFGANPRETLMDKLPALLAKQPDAECARDIIRICDEFEGYLPELRGSLAYIARTAFAPGYTTGTLNGAISTWLNVQPAAKFKRVYGSGTTAMLNVINTKETHNADEWIEKLAVALTGLPVEDWNDAQPEVFIENLRAAIDEIEHAQVNDADTEIGVHIHIAAGAAEIDHDLAETELTGMSLVAYDSMRSTLDEFADSLDTDQKLLILAQLLLRLNERS